MRACGESPAPERDQPGKARRRDIAPESHLDVPGLRERRLELRALEEHVRQAESKRAVEAIVRAAGEDARAGGDGLFEAAPDDAHHAIIRLRQFPPGSPA